MFITDAKPWQSVMRLLQERDASDSELLVYAVTLINKTLHGLADQDSYYDQVEFLESLGMQQIISRYDTTDRLAGSLTAYSILYSIQINECLSCCCHYNTH